MPLVKLIRFVRDFVLDKNWRKTGKVIAIILGFLYDHSKEKEKHKGEMIGHGNSPAKWAMESVAGVPVFQGAWSGNDTIWRMILDLNRIFLYAGEDGNLRDAPCRNVFYVVDGIVIGDRNGPMDPDELKAGLIVTGDNALTTDLSILKYLGVEYNKIPLYKYAMDNREWLAPNGLGITTINGEAMREDYNSGLHLLPPDNWDF